MVHETLTARPTGPLTLHGHDVEGVNRCVHCGLCLAYCPTFSILGTEMDSPRGRIFIVKSLAEGRLKLGDATVSHLDLCLGCRACETVCPSGVPYGQLIEAARAEVEQQRPGGPLRRLFRWMNFALLLPRPRVLGLAAAVRRCRSSHPPKGRSARGWVCSRAASSRSPSARRIAPPRACSRGTAPRWSPRASRPAAARFTPTRASTRWPWTWPNAPSRSSRRQRWTRSSSTPRAAGRT